MDCGLSIVTKIIDSLVKDGIHRDLSILGGEPFAPQNIGEVVALCKTVKKVAPQTQIWVWTGYDFHERFVNTGDDLRQKNFCDIINTIDVVVDGPFVESLKPGEHQWRGSSNQRIINLHALKEEVQK